MMYLFMMPLALTVSLVPTINSEQPHISHIPVNSKNQCSNTILDIYDSKNLNGSQPTPPNFDCLDLEFSPIHNTESGIKENKQNTPASVINTDTKKESTTTTPEELQVFPVGINIGKRNVNPGALVRGKEDGSKAIDFEKWLIPYDTLISALKLDVKTLPDGQLELRSPGFITRIDIKKIRKDPQLGLVFSIQDLQTLFNIPAEFDIKEYAIVLTPSWLDKPISSGRTFEPPVQLEGLPKITAPNFNLTAIEQQVNVNGGGGEGETKYGGNISAIGSALGGSWYLRANQPELGNIGTWNISEAQFALQREKSDYLIGSQSPFWRSTSTGDYWGFTSVFRQGFKPIDANGGAPDTLSRLQSAQFNRTISGRTEPGNFVRLMRGLSDADSVAEVLVDSSGIYRFEIKDDSFVGNYRLLIYPQGRLTATPEIRDVSVSSTGGQIPAGASALVFSGGWRRNQSGSPSLFGDFREFQGGVLQRLGVTEELTVGIGGVYDGNVRGTGEIFYKPKNIPLWVAVSTLTGDKTGNWNTSADVRFQPSNNFYATYRSDIYTNRFDASWRVSKNFGLLAGYDAMNGTVQGGVQISRSSKNDYTFGSLTLDSKNRLRWNLIEGFGALQLNMQGNEIGTLSELSYNLSKKFFSDKGHSLVLGYQTTNSQANSDEFATASWRYRSEQQAVDGNYLWETQLGYGFGSKGNGPIAVFQTAAIPGLLLRARYQGAFISSDQSTFSVELVSSLNLQGGISPGNRRSDRLRTQGGLLIRPFFDRNNNGKRDSNEEYYIDKVELPIILNNRPLRLQEAEIYSNKILVPLKPGTYRVDIDPAGFPPEWQPTTDAYAVEVASGSYTEVLIPLRKSYTISGVVTDATGNAIAGALVEAVGADGQRKISVTNDAGVYYLERLQQGDYQLFINEKMVKNLTLTKDSSNLQELNLKLEK